MITNWNMFPNMGYLSTKFEENELTPLINEINNIEKNNFTGSPYNMDLAGNIEKEFVLKESHSYMESLMIPFYDLYNESFGSSYLMESANYFFDRPASISLDDLWVNFQKKYEFNPVHYHAGVLSFVIWINIPFSFDKENKEPSSINSRTPCPGSFYFMQSDALGHSLPHFIHADSSYNLHGLVFPSKLPHGVNPFFTSEGYRISVSGNLKYK